MSNLTAVRDARFIWEHRDSATREDRVNNVISLAEWQLFSNAQLATLTGLREHSIAEYTRKTDQTGGRLTGESLTPILQIITNEANGIQDDRPVKEAVALGASTRMIAKLSGLNQSKVTRMARRAA